MATRSLAVRAPDALRLLLAAGLLIALAACSPPRPTSATPTPGTDGRTAPTPMTTAPLPPMR